MNTTNSEDNSSDTQFGEIETGPYQRFVAKIRLDNCQDQSTLMGNNANGTNPSSLSQWSIDDFIIEEIETFDDITFKIVSFDEIFDNAEPTPISAAIENTACPPLFRCSDPVVNNQVPAGGFEHCPTLPDNKENIKLVDHPEIFGSLEDRRNVSHQPVCKLEEPLDNKVNFTLEKELGQKTKFSKKTPKKANLQRDYPYKTNLSQKAKGHKRLIIIDGTNVALSHGCSLNFSDRGLKIMIEYFEKMGHKAVAVLPMYRPNGKPQTESTDIDRLYKMGNVIFTPCKNISGRVIISYVDRFIFQLALQKDAVIISNNCYQDLYDENAAFRKIIENRVVGYTWCNDVFLLPIDPYGHLGPTLNEILHRS